MSSSLLLHALSLNDRILEPNQLPVSGQVWGYDKDETGREEFVGNCLSVLSLLGIQDAEINWDDDIMAFDVKRKGQPVTVIISLRDDSLSSDYFYFLGIWLQPDVDAPSEVEVLNDMIVWEDEALLQPAVSYSVRFAAQPLQLPEVRKIIGSEIFAQKLYADAFYLYGLTEAYPVPSGKFIIAPAVQAQNHQRNEVCHALYSLRNLMGLMSCVMKLYDRVTEKSEVSKLCKQMMELLAIVEKQQLSPSEWDALVRKNGAIAVALSSERNESLKLQSRLVGIRRLFDVISHELEPTEIQGLPSIMHRMLMPFDHVQDALAGSEELLGQAERQSQILQPLMQSRMLANQQILLEKILRAGLVVQSEA